MLQEAIINKLRSRGDMPLVDHLEEIRWRIIKSLIAILIVGAVIFFKIQWFTDHVLLAPLTPSFFTYKGLDRLGHLLHLGNALDLPPIDVHMQSASFGSQFMNSFTLAFVGGFIVSFPFIFWQFWSFVKPALKNNELKATRSVIFGVSSFFFIGALFGYYILAPFTFNFLYTFQLSGRNLIITMPTLEDYVENISDIILGCGIAFELPILAVILTKVGLISSNFLVTYRKYALILILVVAAVITPSPDWTSQTIVALPLICLYEIGIIMSKRIEKKTN